MSLASPRPEILVRNLHFRRIWIGLSLLLVCVSLWYFLAPLPPDFARWLQIPCKDKVLHIFAFTALTGWFASLLANVRWRRLALCLVLYGIVIEVLQGIMGLGRQAEALDVVADCVGVAIGFSLATWFGVRLLAGIDAWLCRL